MRSRWRSKILWITLITAIVAFLVNTGLIDLHTSQIVIDLMNIITVILVSFGILNNPCDGENL